MFKLYYFLDSKALETLTLTLTSDLRVDATVLVMGLIKINFPATLACHSFASGAPCWSGPTTGTGQNPAPGRPTCCASKQVLWRNSLAGRWLGLDTFTALARVRSLVWELRAHTLGRVPKHTHTKWDFLASTETPHLWSPHRFLLLAITGGRLG